MMVQILDLDLFDHEGWYVLKDDELVSDDPL